MTKTCPDCGASIGPDLLPINNDCWYWGQMKAKLEAEGKDYDDWKRQGFDPPCQGNNYTQWSERRDRRWTWSFLGFLVFWIAVCVVIALIN